MTDPIAERREPFAVCASCHFARPKSELIGAFCANCFERGHPGNYAAMWALTPHGRNGAEPKTRLDAEDACSAATPEESRAFIETLWGKREGEKSR